MSKELLLNSDQANTLYKQAKTWVSSGMLPDHVNTPAKAFTAAQIGRELGIPPMTAFSSIYVINGMPSLKAQTMLALIRRDHPSAIINFLELSNQACRIKVKRDSNHELCEISFTMEDAKNAELLTMHSRKQGGMVENPSWKKYPRAMLRSRAVSEMARTIFPDSLSGFSYTPEELGANVSQDGTPIDINKPSTGFQNTDEPNKSGFLEQGQAVENSNLDDEIELLPEEIPNEAKPIIEEFEQSNVQNVNEKEISPKPDSQLGDFVFEVGKSDVQWYGKKLKDIDHKTLKRIYAFLDGKHRKGQISWKEGEALIKTTKYLEEYELLNK